MRVCVIAACGNAERTGLGIYTSKAALPLHGRPLLSHQIDFAHRSGFDRVVVITKTAHVRMLGGLLSEDERASTSFVLYDGATGWAGTLGQARLHVADDDEVLLISCDNYHMAQAAQVLQHDVDALFTYTTSKNATNGPVLGMVEPGVWRQMPAAFAGPVFTGYAIVRGGLLFRTLSELPCSERGEKEFTALLESLSKSPRCLAVPYGGEYIDIANLADLTIQELRLRGETFQTQAVQFGAGILLHDNIFRVFLTERQDGLGWVPPGGLVDGNEAYIVTARRELREEMGLHIPERDTHLLGVYPTVGKQGGPACSIIFHAEVTEENLHVNLDKKEVRSCRWFFPDEVKALSIPFDLRSAVNDYVAGRWLDTHS